MGGSRTGFSIVLPCVIVVILLTGTNHSTLAQEVIGASVTFEAFPFASLAEPLPEAPDLEIQTSMWSASCVVPASFSDGKIIMLNRLNYRRLDFNFRNYPESSPDLERAQSIEYVAVLIDSLSPAWKMLVIAAPGFASDFETKLSSDDFTFQGAFGLIRRYSDNLSLGFGAAYYRGFGTPLPLPFLYFDWKRSDKLSVQGIVPSNVDLTYKLDPRIDLVLSLKIVGNRYHGNPNKYPDVHNPQLEYSEGTLSPLARIHFSKWLHLNFEGGFTFYRNFEFLDGDETISSLDLERTTYIRAGLVFGE